MATRLTKSAIMSQRSRLLLSGSSINRFRRAFSSNQNKYQGPKGANDSKGSRAEMKPSFSSVVNAGAAAYIFYSFVRKSFSNEDAIFLERLTDLNVRSKMGNSICEDISSNSRTVSSLTEEMNSMKETLRLCTDATQRAEIEQRLEALATRRAEANQRMEDLMNKLKNLKTISSLTEEMNSLKETLGLCTDATQRAEIEQRLEALATLRAEANQRKQDLMNKRKNL